MGGVVRRGNYKLIHFYDDDSIELYDVVSDQGEKKESNQVEAEVSGRVESRIDTMAQGVRCEDAFRSRQKIKLMNSSDTLSDSRP